MRGWFCWWSCERHCVDRGRNWRRLLIICACTKYKIKHDIGAFMTIFYSHVLFYYVCTNARYSVLYLFTYLTASEPTWALIPSVCITGNSIEQRSDQALVGMLVPQHQVLQRPETVHLHALCCLWDTHTHTHTTDIIEYTCCKNHINMYAC